MMTEHKLSGLRIGPYIRISTDTQDGGSQNQRSEIERFVVKHRLDIIDWYIDDEGHCPRGKRNPDFVRMMADAEKGRIDAILIAYGQRLGFIGPDIVDEFLAKIRALDIPCWDIWERRDLRECYTDPDLWDKVARGTVRSAKDLQDMGRKQLERHLRLAPKGQSPGGKQGYGIDSHYFTPNGKFLYKVIDKGGRGDDRKRIKVMADGTEIEYHGKNNAPPKDYKAEVYPRPTQDKLQLQVLGLMFQWCDTEGMSPYQIAKRLNVMGYRTLGGTYWYGTIVGHYLRDPVYIGQPDHFRSSRARYARVDAEGSIIPINVQNPKRTASSIAPVMPDRPLFEPIIDPQQFWRVQERLNKNKKRGTYATRNPDAWARGLVYCGSCGGTMIYNHDRRNGQTYWRCSQAALRGRVNSSNCGGQVKDATIRAVVERYLAHTKQALQNREESKAHECYVDQLRARFEAMDFGEPDPAKLSHIDTAIQQNKQKIEAIAERVLTCPDLRETETYTRIVSECKRAIADLQWERKELQERPTREQLAARIEEAAKAQTEGTLRAYNEFLKSIIEKIVLYLEPFTDGVKRQHNRKFRLAGVVVEPVNAIVPIAGIYPRFPQWTLDGPEEVDVNVKYTCAEIGFPEWNQWACLSS